MAERRMLWKSISRSRKVNLKLKTLESKLLYTWTIPHMDREGFIEADPASLKAIVVPLVNEINPNNIQDFITEIVQAGLWEIFEVDDTQFVHDPVFLDWQTPNPHEAQSQIIKKIKNLNPLVGSRLCNDKSGVCNAPEGRKEGRKYKGKERPLVKGKNGKLIPLEEYFKEE